MLVQQSTTPRNGTDESKASLLPSGSGEYSMVDNSSTTTDHLQQFYTRAMEKVGAAIIVVPVQPGAFDRV